MLTDKYALSIFPCLAVENINYALISLYYIIDVPEYDTKIFPNPLTYYFYHIQNVLASCGKINSIFYGKSSPYKKECTIGLSIEDRSKLLRETFKISRGAFPLVFKKEARNTDVHIDERFHSFGGRVGDYNLIDNDTPDKIRQEILNTPHLRTFDRSNKIYYTYTLDKDKGMCQTSLNFHTLRTQFEKMKEAITSNQIFEKAWLLKIPGIQLKGKYDSISSYYMDSKEESAN